MTSLTNTNLELKNMFGQFMKMNTASSSGSRTLPSNTITNPKEDFKGITTRSGNVYQGPMIPTTSSPPKTVKRETEVTKNTVPPTNNRRTKDIQPPVFQIEIPIPNSEPISPVTFNLDQTSRYSANYDAMSVNRIDSIDVACEEYSQEVLRFSMSGNPTPSTKPFISNYSLTHTPFGDSDFLLEETDAFLAIDDEPISPVIDDRYYDSEGDILLLKEFLNDDPSSPPLPPQELKVVEPTNERSFIDEPPVVELKDLPPHLEYAFLEVFVDDFSVFKNSFRTCLSHLDKILKWCEDTNLCLNWEKSHFMVKEGIVLGHKISKNGIEVDKAKVDVIAKLPHPTIVKGPFPSSRGNKFGTPRSIISDRGTHFCNDQFAKVMLKYGVTHRLATAYHPKTSGQVEVSNRGLKRILERTLGENRASCMSSTDELEHKAYWALKHCNYDLLTAGDHRKIQLNELNKLRDQAYENSLIYKEKMKRIHDLKIKDRVFNVGDRVLLFKSRLKIFSGKLKTRWSVPFTITQVFPYSTVELSQTDGPNFKVNGHRLKHYFGEDISKMVF
nr:reverse transcriptase domain-containing protein [Tanacetum cinerariifolium]